MKLYHFALFFLMIAVGFFVTAQIETVAKLQEERIERTEYDCLVAAVNAAVDVAFYGDGNDVTEDSLRSAAEVFFQTLAVLHEGNADRSTWNSQREKVPVLVVFDEKGYYRYINDRKSGPGWSKQVFYEDGRIPDVFFDETESILVQFYNDRYGSQKRYRMECAKEGAWEKTITPPCVFAVYLPFDDDVLQREKAFLYAASTRTIETYLVTEDNYCHLPFCNCCETKKVIARYVNQKECAEAGALPCEFCLR